MGSSAVGGADLLAGVLAFANTDGARHADIVVLVDLLVAVVINAIAFFRSARVGGLDVVVAVVVVGGCVLAYVLAPAFLRTRIAVAVAVFVVPAGDAVDCVQLVVCVVAVVVK